MTDLLLKVEASRIETGQTINLIKKKLSEQYFTPPEVSTIMASMFTPRLESEISSLDPCCGVGNLAAALIERGDRANEKQEFYLVELDPYLFNIAKNNFSNHKSTIVLQGDFFVKNFPARSFDRIIMNPPFSKISNTSEIAHTIKSKTGHSETNLYTAFVRHGLQLLKPDGELVAIIPRSFCNGPYFTEFRKDITLNHNIHEIYLFESRKIFSESKVSQELIIIKISKKACKLVKISHHKHDGTTTSHRADVNKVIFPADKHRIIHIPLAAGDGMILKKISQYHNTLSAIGLKASTGKVVEFRCSSWLTNEAQPNTSPILYQEDITHSWPLFTKDISSKKSRYLINNLQTEKLLLSKNNYILIRRISFKESLKRIVCIPLLSHNIPSSKFGIENHVNYIWAVDGEPPPEVFLSLSAYLQTKSVDDFIRRFSGHTQINAFDLNSLPVPTIEKLLLFAEEPRHFDHAIYLDSAEAFFF